MATFADLFARRAAECCSVGTDKNTVHKYADVYEELFAHRKYDVRKILEIGTCSGASAEALADYFPNARVVSLDVAPERLRFTHPRADFFAMDATLPATAEDLARSGNDLFDIVIDDGSHLPAHQIASLGLMWPLLRGGGTYLIEDFDLTNHPGMAGAIERCAAELRADVRMFDLREATGRFDDVIAVLHKEKDVTS